jgi:hypothetical protein
MFKKLVKHVKAKGEGILEEFYWLTHTRSISNREIGILIGMDKAYLIKGNFIPIFHKQSFDKIKC